MLTPLKKWLGFKSPRMEFDHLGEVSYIHQMVQYFDRYIIGPSNRSKFKKLNNQFFAQSEEDIIKNSPMLYLKYEEHLVKMNPNAAFTEQDLRLQVKEFNPGLEKIEALKVIFAEGVDEELELSRLFLINLLEESIAVLGKAQDNFFEGTKTWVQALPYQYSALSFLTDIPFSVDNLQNYLVKVSWLINTNLEHQMGLAFAKRIYDRSYAVLAQNYQALEGFTSILSLIPRDYLDGDKMGLMTKHQLSNALLEKVINLEELNNKLEEKNLALELARAELEEEKRRSEHSFNLLSKVMNAVKDGIITADANGNILMVNKEVENIWGYSKEELIGKSLTMLMPQRYKVPHKKGMRRFLETGKSTRMNKNMILEGKRKSGQEFSIEMNISHLVFEGKHLFTAAVRDISERIRIDTALKSSKKALEMRTFELEKAQKELEITIDELKESNQELERFAYVASHDLQEPLRSVSSYVQLIGRHLGDKIDPELNEYIDFSVSGVKRMQALIRDLLEYSRVGRNVHRPAGVKMEEVLQIVKYNLREIIQSSGAMISFHGSQELKGDLRQLVQLLQNLVSNSIKFCKVDEKPKIQISCLERENDWLIEVKDNGIGINPDFKESIFVIFHRLHTAQEYSGTGIGLAICKKIVERHGGKIWVKSNPNEGASFFFNLQKEFEESNVFERIH